MSGSKSPEFSGQPIISDRTKSLRDVIWHWYKKYWKRQLHCYSRRGHIFRHSMYKPNTVVVVYTSSRRSRIHGAPLRFKRYAVEQRFIRGTVARSWSSMTPYWKSALQGPPPSKFPDDLLQENNLYGRSGNAVQRSVVSLGLVLHGAVRGISFSRPWYYGTMVREPCQGRAHSFAFALISFFRTGLLYFLLFVEVHGFWFGTLLL